ncbi:MAG: PEP-CTERM sorting domain-containing protein [Candidatus Didemnitutus sp.]|nr:PEP-CTERM sorting domain-containing protein [Candidatus Didemnitutus sp.]
MQSPSFPVLRRFGSAGAFLLAALLTPALFAQPITIVQTTAGTYNWSTSNGTLWSSGSPNGAGVLVERNVTGSSISINQDVAGGVTIGGLSLLGSSANSLTILMNNSVSNPSVIFNNNGNGAAIVINSTSAGARMQFSNSTSGTLTLADDLTLTNISYGSTGSGSSAGAINLLVPISGNGNLTIHNAINTLDKGAVVLGATNTFTGNVTIASGITQFTRSNSFGVNSNPVTLGTTAGGDASLIFNATTGANVYNNITVASGSGGTLLLGGTINGNATTAPSTPVFHGKLTLNGDVTLVSKNIGAATVLPQITTFNGEVSGSGNLTVTGSSSSAAEVSVQLRGANTFDGITRIESGVLRIGAASGTNSLALQSSTVDLRSGDTGSLQFGYTTTSGNVTTAQTITSATFGGLTGSRNLALQNIDTSPGAVALKVGKAGGNTTYDGVLSGAGSLEIVNGGVLKLTTAQQYTGTTTVTNGTLILNGSTHASSALSVDADGVLAGSGTINGAATISGTHSPGNSPGIQTFASDLTYNTGATVNWELAANTATQGDPTALFDQVVVNGTLNFAGATSLNLSFNGAGSTVDWSDAFWNSERSWKIYDNASLSNFGNLSLTSSNWADGVGGLFDTLRPGGSFSLSDVEGDVYLNYTNVPEPSTYAAIFGALALGLVWLRRRQARG